eukprot:TRINITY_DN18821_c0_g1::TRINITY_DN18821_c0_g1_i1::g.15234::m.15234 TRINITY_DN18821_c0_g1::TRINITY_DN18821_c0_g1_i1::g.15234  ORF type:complete len:444 (+),score=60.89,Seadorna_VP6/PF07407.6/0.08,DUF972/PF06156.8/0.48,DUF972/PF06156.8/0.042,DUF972/PF06156.8/4.2e+03,DUF3367/PF11847.3/2.2,bZIP_1/PF00170.16/0.98,bZIP_1/PF00170.16/1.4e+02,Med15/PF09606.5/49,Med15/PF09606.5/0.18 TRINITY_DN18821_c0_g1_i1:152-1333(+)
MDTEKPTFESWEQERAALLNDLYAIQEKNTQLAQENAKLNDTVASLKKDRLTHEKVISEHSEVLDRHLQQIQKLEHAHSSLMSSSSHLKRQIEQAEERSTQSQLETISLRQKVGELQGQLAQKSTVPSPPPQVMPASSPNPPAVQPPAALFIPRKVYLLILLLATALFSSIYKRPACACPEPAVCLLDSQAQSLNDNSTPAIPTNLLTPTSRLTHSHHPDTHSHISPETHQETAEPVVDFGPFIFPHAEHFSQSPSESTAQHSTHPTSTSTSTLGTPEKIPQAAATTAAASPSAKSSPSASSQQATHTHTATAQELQQQQFLQQHFQQQQQFQQQQFQHQAQAHGEDQQHHLHRHEHHHSSHQHQAFQQQQPATKNTPINAPNRSVRQSSLEL